MARFKLFRRDRVGGGYVHLAQMRSFSRAKTFYQLAFQRCRVSPSGHWITCDCPNWVNGVRAHKLHGCKHVRKWKKGDFNLRQDVRRITRSGWGYLARNTKP